MADKFNIQITIDGQDAKSEAGKLRKAIEAELGKFEFQGLVDIAGLQAAREQMAGLRQDAGALGRAIAQGLSQQWDALEQRLGGIQSQITGIVRAGDKKSVVVDMLDAMPELEQALSANDKKTLDITLKMQDLSARTNELTRSIAELGRVQVQPLSGGQIRTLSELFKGLSEDYTRGKVTKAVKAIDAELAPLQKQVDAQLEGTIGVLRARQTELRQEVARTREAIAQLEAERPIMPTVFGVDMTAEQQAWQDQYDALITQYEAQNKDLDAVRSEIIQGDATQLRDELMWRRRELERPLEEEFTFWQEWSLGSVKEIADALRATGQGASAEALEQMEAAFEERKRLQTQIKRAFGGLQQGGQAELPQGAQGTMVDFIAAERTLGTVADTATASLAAQTRALVKKVAVFDEARRAAEGFNEAERKAVEQLEKAATREIRQRTPAKTGLEDAADIERDVLGRLAREVATTTQAMETALAEPVTEQAEEEARGLLRLWQWVSDKLVGHSVIPDMVSAINDWLAMVGEDAAQQDRAQIAAAEAKAQALIRLAEMESQAGIEAEKRLTAETVTQAKIRLAQNGQSATRSTVRQRGATSLDVATGKATLKEQERQNRLTSEAQKLAGELGLAWGDVAAGMAASGDSIESVTGGLKRMKQEQATANRATQQQARLQADAQKLAQGMGLSWSQVEDAMQATGAELGDVVRELRGVEAQQRQIADEARRIHAEYRGLDGAVRLFTDELEKARSQSRGLFELSRDLQEVGNSIRMNAGIVTGAVTVAARDYVTFAKQSDVAARSLALSADLTQQLRQLTIEQSATLAVLDPETTARGITVWAQATGQQITSQRELNQLLAQTVPIQQAAALSQTDIATLSDATAGALNQYGLQIEDTTRVVAIFNKIADDTLAAVGDVAESFKYVGPTADRAGESIEQTATAFALLGDNGIRGTQAGTSYGRMLENLLVPNSKEAEELFERLYGTASPFFDAQGQYIGTARAVDMLAAATAGMSDQEREAALNTIFDTNALRAATVLIREQTTARADGVNALEQEAAGLSESALAVWKKQLADWEESDVYRVQQAEMRWKAFWLTVGQQGLDAALPHLERGSKMIQDLIATVQANPWLSETVLKVATGAIVVGAVITAIGSLAKTVLTVKTILDAAKTTLLKRQTAEQRFQTSVISAAEQFRTIITQAATQAAGIEKESAVQEGLIEKKDALEEGAIEKASALNIGKILGTAVMAAAVAEIGSQALTGQSITGWGSTREGERAAETQLVDLQGTSADDLRAKLAQLHADMALLDQYVVQEGEKGSLLFNGQYWKDLIFGAGGADTERTRELLGGGLRATSGQALLDKHAELESLAQGITQMLAEVEGASNDVGVGVARQMQAARGETAQLTDSLYEFSGVAQDAAQLSEEEARAADSYAELLDRQAAALTDFNAQVAELTSDLNADLARLAVDYQRNRTQAEADFYADTAKAQADFQRQQAQAAQDHQKQMARAEEDHYMTLWDLSLARDAAGMYKENQRYQVETRRANEDFSDQQAQAQQEFAIEQAERQQQHAQKMADMAAQYIEERQARLADHAEQVAELQTQHAEDMARLEREYFDKLNAELGYYQRSSAQQAAWEQAMLADAQGWLASKRQLWLDYVASLPTPSAFAISGNSGAAYQQYQQYATGYASGGYVEQTGPALVHQGEYVMTAATVRQLEGVMGNLNQAKLTGMGGTSIPVAVNVNGMGMGPREVARLAAQQVETQLLRVLSEVN